LTARSRVWLRLGAGLSMLPVIAVVLAFFFLSTMGRKVKRDICPSE